ncbi:MAG: phosphopantothenate/pantothenate synthetase [Candidatus Thorarchaeota archaeon]
MTKTHVPADHPRKDSLDIRERIIEGHEANVVATAGLLAHGRGEAFDYLIGERTNEHAKSACRAAVAAILLADHPVISVNGNVCALVPEDLVMLSELTGAPLEINLFYYRPERERAIAEALREAGAEEILGTSDRASETIPELSSNRRKVDSEGIAKADLVLVPLEDGDRTEALRAMDKFVVTIDLNPLSRTSIFSNITIVDNVVRTLPLMVEYSREMQTWPKERLRNTVSSFDNIVNLKQALALMIDHLSSQSMKGDIA